MVVGTLEAKLTAQHFSLREGLIRHKDLGQALEGWDVQGLANRTTLKLESNASNAAKGSLQERDESG